MVEKESRGLRCPSLGGSPSLILPKGREVCLIPVHSLTNTAPLQTASPTQPLSKQPHPLPPLRTASPLPPLRKERGVITVKGGVDGFEVGAATAGRPNPRMAQLNVTVKRLGRPRRAAPTLSPHSGETLSSHSASITTCLVSCWNCLSSISLPSPLGEGVRG